MRIKEEYGIINRASTDKISVTDEVKISLLEITTLKYLFFKKSIKSKKTDAKVYNKKRTEKNIKNTILLMMVGFSPNNGHCPV